MVDISDQDVADALHTDVSGLPTGVESDIKAAEELVGFEVEPYASETESELVKKVTAYVAASFITGTEGDAPVSSMSRADAAISFDTSALSAEGMSFWKRAQALDPTDRLGRDTIGFEAF